MCSGKPKRDFGKHCSQWFSRKPITVFHSYEDQYYGNYFNLRKLPQIIYNWKPAFWHSRTSYDLHT
jgi:hypothetical protein